MKLSAALLSTALLLMPSAAAAQPAPCSPYFEVCSWEVAAFPNVFYNVRGLELAYVNVWNRTLRPITVTLNVTFGPDGRAAEREFSLAAGARADLLLNDWPELAAHSGGVSISVSATGDTKATVTLHPHPSTVSEQDFWRLSRVLGAAQ